jgi:hypothetical protein
VRGLRIEHFYETAVTVTGGKWALEGCEVLSSRAPNRACVGVVLRNASSAEVLNCLIRDCSAAVLLSSTRAHLLARGTSLLNARAAIESVRAGVLDVQECTFEVGTNDVGLRIAHDTAGVVCANRVLGPGSLWGRLAPPPAVRYRAHEDEGADAAHGEQEAADVPYVPPELFW